MEICRQEIEIASMYRNHIKRILDVCLSVIALCLIGWLLIIVSIILYFANGGAGVFFLQDRTGKDGMTFKLLKFKTMTEERDCAGKYLPDSERLTTIGKILRSLSIDELPQLWNVIKGDMSMIGPRPLLPKYLKLYNEEQMRRHKVRPGITGWAQCHGRNAISWTEKFKLDVWYVDNMSFKVDIKILCITLRKVLIREGINGDGQATMEAFNGNN